MCHVAHGLICIIKIMLMHSKYISTVVPITCILYLETLYSCITLCQLFLTASVSCIGLVPFSSIGKMIYLYHDNSHCVRMFIPCFSLPSAGDSITMAELSNLLPANKYTETFCKLFTSSDAFWRKRDVTIESQKRKFRTIYGAGASRGASKGQLWTLMWLFMKKWCMASAVDRLVPVHSSWRPFTAISSERSLQLRPSAGNTSRQRQRQPMDANVITFGGSSLYST